MNRFGTGFLAVAFSTLVGGYCGAIVIDNFSTGQGPLTRTAPGDMGIPISGVAVGGGMIGGERDIEVILTNNTPVGNRITVLVASYNHSQDGGIRGTSFTTWDGVDGNGASGVGINHVGLGGADLTVGGTHNAFQVDLISADLSAVMVFEVFTNAGNSSKYTLNLVSGAINDFIVIPYASFAVNLGLGADFTNVGAITMFIDGSAVPSLDVVVDKIETVPQLTVSKTDAQFTDVDGDGNVDVGDRIKYTITITNPDDDGNFPAEDVVFMDTPDPSTALFVGSVTTTQGVVTLGNMVGDTSVSVNVGDIVDGASVTIMFEVTVTAEDPLVCNQGFADTIPSDDPDTGNPQDPTCTPVTFCGDGIVNDVTEECDDGNLNDNDECSNNCTMGCGNDIVNTGESCDGIAEAPGVDCTLPCRSPAGLDECTCCGDDLLQAGSGEQCDGLVFEPGAPGSHGPCRNDCTFCGDGLVNGGEECDDGNANDNDDCSNNCTMGCGNEIVNTGEACDGAAEAPGVDCTLPCRAPAGPDSCTCCGDDVLQSGSGEQCDGLAFEPGAPGSHGPCRSDCTFCGDGLINGGEQCDDGNANDNDDCSNNCTMGCGNIIINTGESCDGSAEAPGVDCTLPCRAPAGPDSCTCCGDDVLQPGSGEQCDGVLFEPGAPAGHGPCRNDCTFCGDGIVNGGEQCDDGDAVNDDECTNSCESPRCGDGIVQAGEQCDDGNLVNDDACSNACTSPRCGDGILQAGEQCDDGNLVNDDTCTNACTTPRCGDGILQAGEQCDDGNLNNNDNCTNGCDNAVCGDGIVDTQPPGVEQCDDGNANNNDGCTNDCMLPDCGDGILHPGEMCDDGNNTAGDGCSPSCQFEICGNNILDPGEECDGTADAACGPTEDCAADCVCEDAPPDTDIPTVSEWGLVVLALLLLTGWKLGFGPRRAFE